MQMKHKDTSTHFRAALAMCENIDWNVGRLLKKLDELKLDENTIVLYFSDNGPNGERWNNGLKGKKGSVDEGGVLSPLLMRWKGQIKPGTVVKPISGAIDLLPTLTDLCGIPLLKNKPLDGISLKKTLLNGVESLPDRFILNSWRKGPSIRSQKYRLSGKLLFDIEKDPQQTKDIAKKFPEVVQSMKAARDKLLKSIEKEKVEESSRPFVITVPNGDFFQIPARDAQHTKGIERSGRAPNCSFLRGWTDVKDYIYWPATAQVDGKYEVEVYYTCKKEDVGVNLGLSFNGQQITAKVTEAHNPPLFGMDEDHFLRKGESYVKDFKVLKMGTVIIKKGTGELKLEALNKPGKEVIEFRLLTLKRVE